MTTANQSIFLATINALPDDVLVDIFYFYANNWQIELRTGWHTLVHVCQRWRYVVFASPRRLNLRLVYTGKRPTSEMLDIWPALPVVIRPTTYSSSICENITTFLDSGHRHRICEIDLPRIPTSHWDIFAAATQKPFPELTSLDIGVKGNTAVSLPDSFSAPLLRHLSLHNYSFPGVPKLLLSANHLIVLSLWNIPDSEYISSQALGTALSVMSRLETLRVQFRSFQYPASRYPPPLTCSLLPSLTNLMFDGVHEYLEDLLAQIEAPLLNHLKITFFMDVNFVVPQLHQLTSYAESFKKCHTASVYAYDDAIEFGLFREAFYSPDLSMKIKCRELDRQLSSLAQVCNSSLSLLSTLGQLRITDCSSPWESNRETTQWLDFLDPFTSVTDLILDYGVVAEVCRALEEHAEERVTGVLPALQRIFLSGFQPSESDPEFIEGFVAARKLSGHPVALYPWR
ncbi:hypothetical protein F5148DRAFT_1289336 [Russula earlei]|uniref:Uncharacterized protein n=1 Tax=Russula earlei TaxID=71964 RepID=A0ACC0TXT2_9AGAM|nr:hypothetical protein F5148DRAFT_1289336 [Russula earlei]